MDAMSGLLEAPGDPLRVDGNVLGMWFFTGDVDRMDPSAKGHNQAQLQGRAGGTPLCSPV